jgi:hypothetical protein
MRGLYRYETSPGRWWACAETENGQRVNVIRQRYEDSGFLPTFWDLPVQTTFENGVMSKVA